MGFFNSLFGSKPGSDPEDSKPVDPPPAFPYELMRAAGAEAVAQAMRWRKEWRGSFTPIILGIPRDFEHMMEFWEEDEESPENILVRAQEVAMPAWFKQSQEEDPDGSMEELTDLAAWTGGMPPPCDFSTVKDLRTQKTHPWVWITKVPVAEPCDVPAWMKWGGWNACPAAHVHVAAWRYWQQKYGAEILCVTGDVIEATVSRPPMEKEACYALAQEQFAYCDDIVTQGVGSIDALADGLRGAGSWYFWWD